ncbi:MAG: glutamine--fructose-6-phosphate transaminase (isomerizing) [Clostridia bacterium]|nr:glutamine--fructose-6-phosphate transaminase (isomerizing) [Clostridia bacterium]
MCGIVGFSGKTEAIDFLLEGLEKLEYRGYDSAGISVLKENRFQTYKTVKRIESLSKDIKKDKMLNGATGIGHTRWATHGAPSLINSHPHLSSDEKFAVVHNGIIENYAELKRELLADGFEFKSETDTEVIPLLLQKYYKGDVKAAVSSALKRLAGSFALGIICADYPDTVIAAKRFSPLIIGIGDGCNMIASDVTALVSHTKSVIYIEDGETAFLTPNSVEIFDAGGAMANKRISVVDWDVNSAQKGGYDHFMMKEIMEQPDCIFKTLESYIKKDKIELGSIKIRDQKLKEINKIEITACGSAYHAGMVGKYVLEELLRIPVNVDLASEFRYRNPVVDENTLTIAISQSGETADTLAAINEAKKRGSHTVAIVNVVGSSIAKVADDVLYTRAGPEIAVATTKGYSTQLIVLYLLGIWAAEKLGTAKSERLDELIYELNLIPQKIVKILDRKEEIKQLSLELKNPQSVFFIGRNIDYAVSLEASLKLKEISYIHSESYAAGELKHGTISLIEEDVPVVALCGCKEVFEKMLSNIKEVLSRGARVLACVSHDNIGLFDPKIRLFSIPETDPLLLASLEVIPFQLLAYYVALHRDCDIDKPRNLAKSVTVE